MVGLVLEYWRGTVYLWGAECAIESVVNSALGLAAVDRRSDLYTVLQLFCQCLYLAIHMARTWQLANGGTHFRLLLRGLLFLCGDFALSTRQHHHASKR